MPSRLSEYIPEQTVLKNLWWSLYFENCKDVFIYRSIKNSCFAFQKFFQTKLRSLMKKLVKKY